MEETSSLLPKNNATFLPPGQSNPKPGDTVLTVQHDGLSTKQFLQCLEKILDTEQQRFTGNLSTKSWISDALSFKSPRTIFSWGDCLILSIQLVICIITYFALPSRNSLLTNSAEILSTIGAVLFFLVLNLFLSCWEARSRHEELWRQVNSLLGNIRKDLNGFRKTSEWKTSAYPDLHNPDSTCISLQWTFRDGKLVNLPAILLVPGDIILVRPHQTVLCKCKILEEDSDASNKNTILNPSDVFLPEVEGEIESPAVPVSRSSTTDKRFIVLEAPLTRILQESLSQKPLQRPSSMLEKQRLRISGYVQRFLLPTLLILILIGNIVRVSRFDGFLERWPEELVYICLYVTLPLSSMVFPSFWLGVNFIVLARVLSIFHKFRKKKVKHENLREAKLTDAVYVVKADWISTWKRFRTFLEGRNDSLYQTANIVHTLGNVTAICCVDKKGILSWPNPNAEKVLVLRARGESVSTSKASLRQSTSSLQEAGGQAATSKLFDRHNSLSVFPAEHLAAVAEILDITQNGGRAFDIEFDDSAWKRLLGSLKPPGLAVLLNTCNKEVQEYYRQFCDHIGCVAFHHDQTVPVINRRCLCSLSELIGFKKSAESIFKNHNRIAFYRKPAKLTRDHAGRYKTPFPNMLSIFVQDLKSGGLQVMTQGTCDLVLESCTHYWNGHEVRPLNDEDRKHILEFYTRFSMTAYCTAFAYSPIISSVPEQDPDSDPENDEQNVFIELPVEDEDSSIHDMTSQISEPDGQTSGVKEFVENCCQNQIFLGCVAQQYQSRNEFVHLIDLLEQACIRFIHFSPETELRSRVFAERLGLESGWNCHICLDSEGIDPMAVNEDTEDTNFITDTNLLSPRKGLPTIVVEPEINLENRARLPRGIENIREHIRTVDNVPLLVNLFTDCTPATVKEMISIMQENGEVVCCLGSSANLSNCSVFLQADAAIAIDPIFPQTCYGVDGFNLSHDRKHHQHHSPVDLMRSLISLNCSLTFRKDDPMSLMQLIVESRHNLSVLRHCFKYQLSAAIFIAVLQVICSLACLPPSFSVGHVLVFICFTVPLLSLALLSAPHDRNLMRISTGKNAASTILDSGTVFRFARTFLARWLPSAGILFTCHYLVLADYCVEGALRCYPLLTKVQEPRSVLLLSQNLCALLAVVYFIVISLGYGNNKSGHWKYSMFRNFLWILASIMGILVQLIYFLSEAPSYVPHQKLSNSTTTLVSEENVELLEWRGIPLWVWLTGFLWPVVLLPLNELIKRCELAELDKLQKRARLQFGTKLGMNSPF